MKETKLYCDRCREEIGKITKVENKKTRQYDIWETEKGASLDLCPACYYEFTKWLKGKDKVESEEG